MKSLLWQLGAVAIFVLLPRTVVAADSNGDKAASTPKSVAPQPPPYDEERLRRVIKETVLPKQATKKPLPPEVAATLNWSQPVNGLAARIEYLSDARGTTAMVRLRACLQIDVEA
jgi:hypothetical protein